MYESKKWQIPEEERQGLLGAMEANLAAMRVMAGISQSDLAQVIGISRQTYSAMETGKRPIPWETYMALCFFFSNNPDTRNAMYRNKSFPFEALERFNEKELGFYELLRRMSGEMDVNYEKLDEEALNVIHAVMVAEFIRCNKLSLIEGAEFLLRDRDTRQGKA